MPVKLYILSFSFFGVYKTLEIIIQINTMDRMQCFIAKYITNVEGTPKVTKVTPYSS
jgi:hypothetical protein